jgi:hypothetical protein
MAEIAVLALLTAAGIYAIRNPQLDDDEKFDPSYVRWDNPIQLPRVEGRDAEPHAIPWDDLNRGEPLPQANRSILVNRPLIYIPHAEVRGEQPKVQRDPLYPDDLRSYDHLRARGQKVLMDTGRRNYQFGNYHIPYLAQNKTHQEAAQSTALAGRIYNAYTTGGQDTNGAITNIKDSSVQVVRQLGDAHIRDRPTTQVWQKTQYNEFVGDVHQTSLAQQSAIKEPTEHVLPTKLRSTPKYFNAAGLQNHFTETSTTSLSARDNRAEIASIDTMYKKKLILRGDQGNMTSIHAHIAGFSVDGNALTYPPTNRRREILPEVTTSGLFQQGTGRTFIDANTGSDGSGGYLHNREKQGPNSLTGLAAASDGLGRNATQWSPFQDDPIVDRYKPVTGTFDAWFAQGQGMAATEYAHAIETPLTR